MILDEVEERGGLLSVQERGFGDYLRGLGAHGGGGESGARVSGEGDELGRVDLERQFEVER